MKWWEEKVKEIVGEGERGEEEKVRKRREDRQGRERKVAWRGMEGERAGKRRFISSGNNKEDIG